MLVSLTPSKGLSIPCWVSQSCLLSSSTAVQRECIQQSSRREHGRWADRGVCLVSKGSGARRRKVCISCIPQCCGRARPTLVINQSFKSVFCRTGARVDKYPIWWCWAHWLVFVKCCRKARWYSWAGFCQCLPKRKSAVEISRDTCSFKPGTHSSACWEVAEGTLLVLRLQSRFN